MRLTKYAVKEIFTVVISVTGGWTYSIFRPLLVLFIKLPAAPLSSQFNHTLFMSKLASTIEPSKCMVSSLHAITSLPAFSSRD